MTSPTPTPIVIPEQKYLILVTVLLKTPAVTMITVQANERVQLQW